MLEPGDDQVDVQLQHVEDALLDLGLPPVGGAGRQELPGNRQSLVSKEKTPFFLRSGAV